MPTGTFAMTLDHPVGSEDYLPPEDPLGELSSFELGIRRFCYERNHQVSLRLDGETRRVLLFPDMALLIEWLPEKLAQLETGKEVELEFPESAFLVAFTPVDGELIGTLRTFGRSISQKQFRFASAQVEGELRRFMAALLQRAVAEGYLRQEESDQFFHSGWSWWTSPQAPSPRLPRRSEA